MNKNITWHMPSVFSSDRFKRMKQASCTVWMTGLSGSGKSTIAQLVSKNLHENNINEFVLDGDNIRHGLCSDLGFKASDRKENVRRIAETAKILNEAGITAICPVISPYTEDRLMVKSIIGENKYIEVFCNCDLKTCEQRDPKGLYKLARQGKIIDFTGISAPYQTPTAPSIIVDTSVLNKFESATHIISYLRERKQYLPTVSFNSLLSKID